MEGGIRVPFSILVPIYRNSQSDIPIIGHDLLAIADLVGSMDNLQKILLEEVLRICYLKKTV